MRLLGLDLSSKCGWALLDGDSLEYGLIRAPMGLDEYLKCHGYPHGFIKAVGDQAEEVLRLVLDKKPSIVVIEETNLGKQRYTQKYLEWLHKSLLDKLLLTDVKVVYVSSSQWRSALSLVMSRQDRKNNQKLSKARKLGVDKKVFGVRGKITKKHLAVRYVNEKYKLGFKVKDNDVADAICLCDAFLSGVIVCDGH